MTYKKIVVEALVQYGGHAYYEDIYKFVEEKYKSKLSSSWQAIIRATIEKNSSDSEAFDGKEDLFYSVDGLGKGHWGLRNYESPDLSEFTQDDDEFSEGKFYLKQHLIRERNPKLIAIAKKQFKQKNGHLYCQVCGFDFEEAYGDLGNGFIEAHHVKPVSAMKPTDKTKVEDIIMVCSNCHSMIHRKKPWLSYEEIKSITNVKNT